MNLLDYYTFQHVCTYLYFDLYPLACTNKLYYNIINEYYSSWSWLKKDEFITHWFRIPKKISYKKSTKEERQLNNIWRKSVLDYCNNMHYNRCLKLHPDLYINTPNLNLKWSQALANGNIEFSQCLLVNPSKKYYLLAFHTFCRLPLIDKKIWM